MNPLERLFLERQARIRTLSEEALRERAAHPQRESYVRERGWRYHWLGDDYLWGHIDGRTVHTLAEAYEIALREG